MDNSKFGINIKKRRCGMIETTFYRSSNEEEIFDSIKLQKKI